MNKYLPAFARDNPWAAGAAVAILGIALWNWYQGRNPVSSASASTAPASTTTQGFRGLQSLSRMRGMDLTNSLYATGDDYAGGGLLGLPR